MRERVNAGKVRAGHLRRGLLSILQTPAKNMALTSLPAHCQAARGGTAIRNLNRICDIARERGYSLQGKRARDKFIATNLFHLRDLS